MRHLKLTDEQIAATLVAQGRFCRVLHGSALAKFLAETFGPEGLCLKMMRAPGDVWEAAPLEQVMQLQNLAAERGLAPHVYEIVALSNGYLAMVTDWAPPGVEPTLEGIGRLVQFLLEMDVQTAKRVGPEGPPKWDVVVSNSNWSGDLFLDWGGLYLPEKELTGD